VVNQLCDLVEIRTSEAWTTIGAHSRCTSAEDHDGDTVRLAA